VASEALTSLSRYAHATAATVRVARTATGARVEITNDGIGGADAARGTGLYGLADRVEALDGSCGCLAVMPGRPRDGRHCGVAVSGKVNPLAISQIGRISSKMPPGTSAPSPIPAVTSSTPKRSSAQPASSAG
jgi:hypothetical protein